MAVRQGIFNKAGVALVSTWLVFMPLSVQALGFGKIKLNSTLNEPLDAEIELLSATEQEIEKLDIRLASQEAFLRAGVEKTNLLSDLRFKIKEDNGGYYIHVTTPRTVREPFLNFLLEMNWENGRMLREYTVLLDPPGRVQQQEAVVEAPDTAPPVVEAPQPQRSARAPQPAPESPFVEPAPEPAPTPVAEAEPGELYPQIPLDTPPQGPPPEASMQAEEEALPAPAVETAEPALEVEDVTPAPQKAEPAPDQVAQAPAQPFVDEGQQRFPYIPLTAYGEQAQAPAPAAESYEPVGDLDYGITRKGDNVWTIAQKIRPSDEVSIYQVMMALQRSNPDAFIDGNVHRLKEGQVLRIDDASLLTAMSKSDAAQAYRQQTQAWQDYLAQAGSDVPRQAIQAGDTAEAAPDADGPASGEVVLSTPSGEDVAAAGTSGEAASADLAMLQEQVRQAREEAAGERRRNAENIARLEELEQRLDELNRTISIRNDELAQLRATLDKYKEEYGKLEEGTAQPSEPSESGEPTETAAAPTEPKTGGVWGEPSDVSQEEMAESSRSGGVWGEAASEQQSADEQETQVAMSEGSPGSEADTATFAPQAPQDTRPSEPSPAPASEPPAASQPAPPPAPQQGEGGIMGMAKGVLGSVAGLFQGGLYIVIGAAAGIIVLLLAIAVLIRRRRGMQFQESILTGGSAGAEAQSATAEAAGPTSDSNLASGESSFLSDFAISGVSAIQAEDSEVDPLTEADVFMAYGRYEAAEERLQEAIKNDPGRGELRVKLLELYSTTKNKVGFESVAEDFYATLGEDADNDPLWQKVVSMGKDIAPDNPLFSRGGGGAGGMAAAGAAGAAAGTSGLSDSQVMDIGLDSGVFQSEDFEIGGETSQAGEQAGGDALDFNLEGAQAGAGGEADLDFNLDLGDAQASEQTDRPKPQGDDLDFNLDMGSEAEGTAGGGADLDFNLDMADAAASEQTEPPRAHGDELDFSLDLDNSDEPTTENAQPQLDDAGLEFDLEEPQVKDQAAGPVADDTESLEFNLDMSDEEPTAIDMNLEGGGEQESEDLSLDFDLQDQEQPAKPAATGDLAEASGGEGDLDMNLDASDAIDLDMPSGGDEVGTKLDLAKAYIDMGDPEGARSILDEVMQEGDEGQKQEAEQLMQQIV